MSWKSFEEECVRYLNNKYGSWFKLKGESDSTISDIFFDNGIRRFYIEAKMSKAQCGQFVLLPDLNDQIFRYSNKNKTLQNKFTDQIISYMNNYFHKFYQVGTSGINIELPKSVFYNFILDYYQHKGVDFFITKSNQNFLIFPVSQFSKYFDVTTNYRLKKSGSSNLNDKNKIDFENAMRLTGFKYRFTSEIDIVSDVELNGKRIKGKNYDYLLKKKNNAYTVRKLSNTKNMNVIFSIQLFSYITVQRKLDIIAFENAIKKE